MNATIDRSFGSSRSDCETPSGPTGVDVATVLLRLAASARSQIAAAIGRHRMTLAQYEILQAIDRIGPMTYSTLAHMLGRHRTTISVTVNNLQRDGLVTRSDNPLRPQQHIVTLTDTGTRALDRANSTVAELRQRFDALDVDHELLQALTRIEAQWAHLT